MFDQATLGRGMYSDTDNPYWDGEAHPFLKRERIKAGWARKNYSHISIDAANRAFCIWYWGQQTLNDTLGEPHWSRMYKTMRECANEGWGLGVSDLREAMLHLAQNGTWWKDDNTKTYFGGEGKSYRRTIISDMPEGCANFLNAVDERLPELKDAMQAYQQRCEALRRLNVSSSSSTSDWDRMKNDLSAIKSHAERAKSMMWMLPPTVTARMPNTSAGWSAARRVEEFADGATTWVNRSVKVFDVVGKITDGITVYTEARDALGGDRRAGLAFAALHYSMNFVPVLGSFYGTMVSKIPGLVNNWREFMVDYTRRFDDPEAWLRERANRPRPWKCPQCGSSGGYL